MKSFASDTNTALLAGRAAKRDMILFDFSEDGLHGFWSGTGVFTYQSVDYVGAGRLMKLDAIGGKADLSAQAITGTLSAVPNSDLTPDVLATIESYKWHQSPVVISRAYFNLDTRALLSVERMFRGYFDKLDHKETVGGGYTLEAYFESKSRDHLKQGFRMRGDADQRRVKASDGSLRYSAVAGNQQIPWGQTIDAPSSSGRILPVFKI